MFSTALISVMIIAMATFGVLLVEWHLLTKYNTKIWKITARTLLVIAVLEIIFGVFIYSPYFILYGFVCAIYALTLFKMIDKFQELISEFTSIKGNSSKELIPELISIEGNQVTVRMVLPSTKYPPE